MEQVLLVIHVVIAVGLIGAVLLQRSESDGFGLGSGSGSNFMTGRAAASLMTRTTAILATLFILNSLALSMLAAHHGHESIVTTIGEQQQPGSEPAVPVAIDKDSKAVGVGLNRDAEVDTNKVAKDAAAKKAEPAPAANTNNSAPAVPVAK